MASVLVTQRVSPLVLNTDKQRTKRLAEIKDRLKELEFLNKIDKLKAYILNTDHCDYSEYHRVFKNILGDTKFVMYLGKNFLDDCDMMKQLTAEQKQFIKDNDANGERGKMLRYDNLLVCKFRSSVAIDYYVPKFNTQTIEVYPQAYAGEQDTTNGSITTSNKVFMFGLYGTYLNGTLQGAEPFYMQGTIQNAQFQGTVVAQDNENTYCFASGLFSGGYFPSGPSSISFNLGSGNVYGCSFVNNKPSGTSTSQTVTLTEVGAGSPLTLSLYQSFKLYMIFSGVLYTGLGLGPYTNSSGQTLYEGLVNSTTGAEVSINDVYQCVQFSVFNAKFSGVYITTSEGMIIYSGQFTNSTFTIVTGDTEMTNATGQSPQMFVGSLTVSKTKPQTAFENYFPNYN